MKPSKETGDRYMTVQIHVKMEEENENEISNLEIIYRRPPRISPWAYTLVAVFWGAYTRVWAYTRGGLIHGGYKNAKSFT